MTTKVHILASCLNDKLLDATLLVFRTVRVGFPNAEITVWNNGLGTMPCRRVMEWVKQLEAIPFYLERTHHDKWVSMLLETCTDPFWIVDTDVVFFGSVEGFARSAMAGRYEPAFVEPWTKTHRVERLHTCVMFMDPGLIQRRLREWMAKWHPKGFPFIPEVNLVRQQYVPQNGKPPLFYDTCAGLFHAIGGAPFTDDQDQAFEHLHCGAYSDRIEQALPGIGKVHRAVFADVNAARGLREQQSKFYQEHAIL